MHPAPLAGAPSTTDQVITQQGNSPRSCLLFFPLQPSGSRPLPHQKVASFVEGPTPKPQTQPPHLRRTVHCGRLPFKPGHLHLEFNALTFAKGVKNKILLVLKNLVEM